MMSFQAYVEKAALPEDVFSNVFFSELDTGVDGCMLFEGGRATSRDAEMFTISSGKFPELAMAAAFTGFRLCSDDIFCAAVMI
jgi:hypothetical protein